MGLTPQSMPSPPSSPDPYYPYQSEPRQPYEYPSPAHSDQNNEPPILYGLGLFDCPIPLTDAERHVSVSPLPSSQAVSSWSTSALQPHATTSQSPPPGLDFSLEYDHYPHYTNAGDGYDHYSSVNSTLPTSPVPSLEDSQIPSYSSLASTPYYSGSLQHGFDPRVKVESNWSHDPIDSSSCCLLPPISLSSGLPPMDTTISSSRVFDPNYYQQPSLGWTKFDQGNSMPSPPQMAGIDGRESVLQRDRRSTSVTRVRQPRKLTTKEDANFQCLVKGCGKLFGRSYNYKAHMETHDAHRVYPFPCQVQDCTKKFVRKTDLQRHHQSVHMKQRNFKCDYCSRHFARKDTMRRHMDDGCSKRFDVSTVDFSNQCVHSADGSEPKTTPQQQYNFSGYPPSTMHHYPPLSQPMTTPYSSHSAESSPYLTGSSPYLSRDQQELGIQPASTWSS